MEKCQHKYILIGQYKKHPDLLVKIYSCNLCKHKVENETELKKEENK